MKKINDLESYWMPFTANRDFKKEPRIVCSAEGMYYKNQAGTTLRIETIAEDTSDLTSAITKQDALAYDVFNFFFRPSYILDPTCYIKLLNSFFQRKR